MDNSIGTLCLRDLKVFSDTGRDLLSIASLDIQTGERVGIEGPSGAGKSTLLHALAGLQAKTTGTIKWGEFDVYQATVTNRSSFRREHLGFVFQEFHLFDELNPRQNGSIQALFRPRTERSTLKTRAESLLEQLNVGNRASTDLKTYSAGEKQRISVARAMAHRPSVLLADEPTASLDREAADRLAGDLLKHSKDQNMTLVMVSHDPSILKQMDRIITIKDGYLQ